MLRQRKSGQPRRKMSPAQEAANNRSFRIFRLRGLWYLAYVMSPVRRAIVQGYIDQDLADLGAEAESVRQVRRLQEFEERYPPPIPF